MPFRAAGRRDALTQASEVEVSFSLRSGRRRRCRRMPRATSGASRRFRLAAGCGWAWPRTRSAGRISFRLRRRAGWRRPGPVEAADAGLEARAAESAGAAPRQRPRPTGEEQRRLLRSRRKSGHPATSASLRRSISSTAADAGAHGRAPAKYHGCWHYFMRSRRYEATPALDRSADASSAKCRGHARRRPAARAMGRRWRPGRSANIAPWRRFASRPPVTRRCRRPRKLGVRISRTPPAAPAL